ncbi:hypothetical protein ACLQ2Q_04150 [Microbacterium sp. DT81.1]|uniref:hypothetical protein n=1 Tax=Microbacterium sp. DT81.1 TaxID=3393413 RepID=UPI003CF94458
MALARGRTVLRCHPREPDGPDEPAAISLDRPWADLWLSAAEWAEAFDAADPGTPHNEARDQVWGALLDILTDQLDDAGVPPKLLRRELAQNEELTTTFTNAWPLLDPAGVVGELWSVPAYLAACAPWLSAAEVSALQRRHPAAWTVSDLPFLDAARRRVGDPEASRRRRREEAAAAAERDRMADVVADLIASDDSEMLVMSMLRGEDLQNALANESTLPRTEPEVLAGPFAHIIVDEAQELTDAEWRMLLGRCPSRSFTIVGDRAQARHGFAESWEERLRRIGVDRVELASLSINYRTPEEIMAEAEPVIRAALPDANVPTPIRRSGIPVLHAPASELPALIENWLATHAEGIACVIGDTSLPETTRVRSLTPELSKGLEFDLVVVVDPDRFGTGIEGAVDRYVAMTRATQQLVVVESAGRGHR